MAPARHTHAPRSPRVTRKAASALEAIEAERRLAGRGPSIAWLARTLRVSRARARFLVDVLYEAGHLETPRTPLTPVPENGSARNRH